MQSCTRNAQPAHIAAVREWSNCEGHFQTRGKLSGGLAGYEGPAFGPDMA